MKRRRPRLPRGRPAVVAIARLRRRTYEILEEAPRADPLSRGINFLLVALITVNLLAVVLESVPSLSARYHLLFFAIEIVSLVVFTVEYAARIWVGDRPAAPPAALPAAVARLYGQRLRR